MGIFLVYNMSLCCQNYPHSHEKQDFHDILVFNKFSITLYITGQPRLLIYSELTVSKSFKSLKKTVKHNNLEQKASRNSLNFRATFSLNGCLGYKFVINFQNL